MTQDHLFQTKATAAETLLKQLANRNRLMILCTLISGEKNVSDLIEATKLSQSSVSQHLAKLKSESIIVSRKIGRQVFYRLNNMKVIALISTLHLIYCSD
ncbi:MAG: winged helix-turn-helix transcriptional regulator [Candidatus Paracaedibacteraceae bacterium]|nr:winged helix-turn-helix transcriptional regulator [Candidatus Paracaedibacteraceae bacterium]